MFDKSTKGKLLYIRHGETEYNKKLVLDKDTQISEKFIDSSLSDEGVAQAKELSTKLREIEIRFVFCSPLNRCLETALISLQSHPQANKLTVIIFPFITEVVNGAQDLSIEITKKKEKFNSKSEINFDWSYFDYYFPGPTGDFYYLAFVDNIDPQSKTLIENLRQITSREKKEGAFSKFLNYFISKNKRPESLSNLFNRAVLFKKFLTEFLQNDQNQKTLVITHSAFIRMSTTEMAFKMDKVDCYPDDCYRPDNCEVISMNI